EVLTQETGSLGRRRLQHRCPNPMGPQGSGQETATATRPPAISSAGSRTTSAAPSSPSSPPRTAAAPRSSPVDGATCGSPRLSTSRSATVHPGTFPASPSSPPLSPAPPSQRYSPVHPGPTRRFYLNCPGSGLLFFRAQEWFQSRALANLQELDISHAYCPLLDISHAYCPLLEIVLRSASTILVAKISHCDLPGEIVPCMNFPLLKKLTLFYISISQDAFHRLLSCCHALESLYMAEVRAAGCLRVSSPTITTIIFRHSSSEKTELVIEDAPCLLRLLLTGCNRDDCVTVRVISAPNLKILGPFLVVVSKLLLFQGINSVSSTNSMRTLKVLALKPSGDKLLAVLNILRWFPCLEKLCIYLS
uniref:F-box/LRR-repeat protein 15/At3g58940/PEG3-like LRR domain-containing protein n=1 Tax=Aegilops tauschii subsp. strangulata TaxID=200361 RepID=A0A453N375_AEGTS